MNIETCRIWSFHVAAALFLIAHPIAADGVVIDRIYDPYVQPLENELEWRLVNERDSNLANVQKYFFGFGKSLSDRWAAEIKAIGLKEGSNNISFNNYELEAKWQLTEQGEYALDWGLLFEFEHQSDKNFSTYKTSLLTSKDVGRWTTTANLGLLYEWGSGVNNEVEATLRAGIRYRLRAPLEPGFEIHIGHDTVAVGPAARGLLRLFGRKKLRWELGYFVGFDEQSADQTIKVNMEFEF